MVIFVLYVPLTILLVSVFVAVKSKRKSVMFLCISLGLVSAILFSLTAIAIDGLTDSAVESDVIVVLGNEVLANGEPTDRLAARLDKAGELFIDGKAPIIVVSGGVGASGFDEAEVMKQYLVDSGVEEDAIIEDSKGNNTQATAQNTKQILDELVIDGLISNDEGSESAIIVSQFFHISRTKLAFERNDIEVSEASADYFEMRDFYSLPREVPAYVKYALAN